MNTKTQRMDAFLLFLEKRHNFSLKQVKRDDKKGIIDLTESVKFLWWVFIILLLCGVIFGIVYLVCYFLASDWKIKLFFDKDGWIEGFESNERKGRLKKEIQAFRNLQSLPVK